MADTLGEVVDFLGATLPSELEQGDIITDVVVIVAYSGDRGERVSVLYPENQSWVKAEGMLRIANDQGALAGDITGDEE